MQYLNYKLFGLGHFFSGHTFIFCQTNIDLLGFSVEFFYGVNNFAVLDGIIVLQLAVTLVPS